MRNDDGGRQSAACHENWNASSENVAKVYCACHTERLLTRNETMWRLKPPKVTHFAELTIGTAIRPSHGLLRTVGNGYATSSEHTLNPQTPRVKREPLLRIREKTMCTIHTHIYIYIYAFICHVQNILYWRWSSIPSWESHHTGYIDSHSLGWQPCPSMGE